VAYPNQSSWPTAAPPYVVVPPTNGMAIAALIIGYLQVALIVGVFAVAAILVALGAQ